MRIALTSSFFRPKTSGSAHFSAGLAAELAALGHEVLVFTCTPGDRADDAKLPYRVVRLPALNANLGRFSYGYEIPFCTPRGVLTLWRELRAFRPDVLHVNEQFFDLSVWAGLWGRRHGVPRVMTLHTAFTHNVAWIHAALRAVDATIVSWCLAICDPTLVTIDKFMDRYAAQRFPRRHRDFVAIPVKPDVFTGGNPSITRADLDLSDRPAVLSLGHVIPLRDRLLLVEALPAVLAEVPDLALVVVGRVYDERFLREAEALGVRDAVITTGEVPHERVRDYVALATLECHETQSYGLGTASLEVMGSGLPVVAVVDDDNFPGFALEDRRHLVLARPDPASLAAGILALLRDPELRARVAAGGRELILDHFQIRRVAEDYVTLYQRSSAG
jgi:glycosyltransferase involved in cell wall biosynthesis